MGTLPGATNGMPIDNSIVKRLLEELLAHKGVLVVVDSGGAVAELHPPPGMKPDFEDEWAMLEAGSWHVHLNLLKIDGVQFVDAEDNFHSFPRLYYVRMSDADERTTIRLYFPNPWLDDDERPTDFQPEKLKLFEDLRDRYVGSGGVVFVRR